MELVLNSLVCGRAAELARVWAVFFCVCALLCAATAVCGDAAAVMALLMLLQWAVRGCESCLCGRAGEIGVSVASAPHRGTRWHRRATMVFHPIGSVYTPRCHSDRRGAAAASAVDSVRGLLLTPGQYTCTRLWRCSAMCLAHESGVRRGPGAARGD